MIGKLLKNIMDKLLNAIVIIVRFMIILGSVLTGAYIVEHIEYKQNVSEIIKYIGDISIFIFFWQLGIIISKMYPKL